ncbi:hypothetical protein [Nocardia transvalensis]|nr:hypothetical protein [Nocardia transvalensis]
MTAIVDRSAPDIVITDVPYGQQVHWHGGDEVPGLLAVVRPGSAPGLG